MGEAPRVTDVPSNLAVRRHRCCRDRFQRPSAACPRGTPRPCSDRHRVTATSTPPVGEFARQLVSSQRLAGAVETCAADKPTCVRIRTITSRSLMTAMNFIRPSHRGHASTSHPHTRCIRLAQSMRAAVLRAGRTPSRSSAYPTSAKAPFFDVAIAASRTELPLLPRAALSASPSAPQPAASAH